MIGMTFIALLNVFNRKKQMQNAFLKGLLLLLMMHLAGELFIYSGAYVYAPGIAGLQMPFRVLLGPALYYYAHASMSADKVTNKTLKRLTTPREKRALPFIRIAFITNTKAIY